MTLMMSGGTCTALCNKCCRWTNQHVAHVETTSWSEKLDAASGYEISGSDEYRMLRCMGCDTISVAHTSYFSEGEEPTESRYPPASARRKPSWATNFFLQPKHLVGVLTQIYIALENESYRLCGIGVRALIEDVMIDKVGDKGSIGLNIEAFIQSGFVAAHAASDFKTRVIEVGNASMHRGHEPTRKDVEALLDIVEALIATIYVHPAQMKSLSPVPPRSNKT